MLDIGGVLTCRIYQHTPGFFQIYILANSLGIEPGDVILANDNFMKPYRDLENEGPWYIRLYTSTVSKKNKHKRKYHNIIRIPEEALENSEYYNEMMRISEVEIEDVRDKWFTQDIKASLLLPLIKERSKIPNSLIYVDEYWKNDLVLHN